MNVCCTIDQELMGATAYVHRRWFISTH